MHAFQNTKKLVYLLEIEPHDCHSCYRFAIQQTLETKSAYHSLNRKPHPSEPCVLTTRLTLLCSKEFGTKSTGLLYNKPVTAMTVVRLNF